jgi:molybdate transport repressor ModE-like protein
VELRHLVTLSAVADEGSLAAAARKLGYSQSAISRQLTALESLVGSILVERHAGEREATLTEAGRCVLRHGQALLTRAHVADAELRALQTGTAGLLRLGNVPGITARLCPALLRQSAQELPQLEIELVEDARQDRLLDRLEAGDLDLALVSLPLCKCRFESRELLRSSYVLLAAADCSPRGQSGALTVLQLESLVMIASSHDATIDNFCQTHGITPHIRRIAGVETMVGLAAAGLGVAFLPRLALDPSRRDIRVIELADELPPSIICIAWHREREPSQLLAKLVAIADRVCKETTPSPSTRERHE